MREQLKNDVEDNEKDIRCLSLAWDWLFQGFSSLGVARELSTSVIAHNRRAYYNFKNRGHENGEQIVGKAMHFIVSLAHKLNHDLASGGIGSKDMHLVEGILPVLTWAKRRLKDEELIMKEAGIKDDYDDEGLGPSEPDFERYECALCFGELWCYYCSISSRDQLCLQCCHSGVVEYEKKEYRQRMKNLTAHELDRMIQSFEELTQATGHWWHHGIIKQMEQTHSQWTAGV